MKKLTSKELKKLWFTFFIENGFTRIPSASLSPENDATVLFTTAGMHPLVPYLLGEKHPLGTKLCDVQKCVRTNDIDEVGDKSHNTFFEMLGNWTLGTCDKKKMIALSFEFLTSEKYLGIPKEKLAVSVFAGDEIAPKDEEAYKGWCEVGLLPSQIFYLPKENNWWALGGGIGPCGPDSEMFFDTGKEKCSSTCSPACDCGKYLEIWNDVFMQYNVAKVGDMAKPLALPNVDTGMGVERTVGVINGVSSSYEVGVLKEIISFLEKESGIAYADKVKAFRIIADHLRASTFILGDEASIVPSNVGQGYVLRRLIRRAINYCRDIGLTSFVFPAIVDLVVNEYGEDYPELFKNEQKIKEELLSESERFENTLALGHKEFDKVVEGLERKNAFMSAQNPTYTADKTISGKASFHLYDTFGFPVELTEELAKEKGLCVDKKGFDECFAEHQEKSRAGGDQLFKGGLADQSEMSAKYHTATHIMLAGLRKMFGEGVFQRGSNITPERLRFDFSFDRKMTPEEIQTLQKFVNDVIAQKIEVVCEKLSLEEARASGAMGIFENKYGDVVKVYTIGKVSKEICGGPHAKNTGDLGTFEIVKEESSSAGVRRIKAILK